MEQSGRPKFATTLAVLLPLFLCLSSISAMKGKDLFASLDFAREALISFRNSSKAKPSSSSNKFLQALSEVERAVVHTSADARRPKYSQAKLKELAERIKKATDARSFSYGRALLGEALDLVEQQTSASSGVRTKRTAPFLTYLLNEIGQDKFDTLMAVEGEVTLIFVIDDTGSMANDIVVAKEIAKEIIDYNRNLDVDYILSPFNDPEPEPSRMTWKDENSGGDFVQAIDDLTAHGGGDCPEYAFRGMNRALAGAPQPSSPMFVFTDAYPKDAVEGFDSFVMSAQFDEISVNFFLTGKCYSSGSYDAFEEVATETGGQVFHVSDATELRMLSGLVSTSLGGSSTLYTSIPPSASGRRKRGASATKHSIPVDDTIESLTITLTAVNPAVITLQNPFGATYTSGKVSLSKAVVYQIKDPQAGVWKLVVPGSVGKYEFRVKSTSSTNIDFQHFFLFTPPRSRQKDIPITQPISGEKTQLVITVAGAEKIDPRSLSLELITDDGKLVASVVITPKGSSAAHYLGTMVTPSKPFQLKLKGLTKKGNKFERISNIIEPKTGVMRAFGATNDFTLGVGRTNLETVVFKIYNAGPYDTFNLTAKDSLGCSITLVRKTARVRQKSSGIAIVRLWATNPADIGKTNSLSVTAKGQTSGLVLSHMVRLLVVDARVAP